MYIADISKVNLVMQEAETNLYHRYLYIWGFSEGNFTDLLEL